MDLIFLQMLVLPAPDGAEIINAVPIRDRFSIGVLLIRFQIVTCLVDQMKIFAISFRAGPLEG